jgi:hypothetical protein
VGQRFRSFRTEFGKAVAGGAGGDFVKALGRYARTATGGVDYGPRRFGTAYSAGGSLVDVINELGAGGTGEQSAGIDLSGLVGQPIAIAAEQIANVLSPDNADKDLIRISIQEAIAIALPDVEFFDPKALTPDDVISLLVEFYTQVLFREIAGEAGDAWDKSDSPQRTIEAEAELMDLIHTAVDRHLSPTLANGLGGLSNVQLKDLQQRAVADIWSEWSTYQ